MLVYELKIPLIPTEEYPYAIKTKAGDSMGIGLEAPKTDMSAMRDRMGGGMRGGGRQMPSELKVLAVVQLASPNNEAQD